MLPSAKNFNGGRNELRDLRQPRSARDVICIQEENPTEAGLPLRGH